MKDWLGEERNKKSIHPTSESRNEKFFYHNSENGSVAKNDESYGLDINIIRFASVSRIIIQPHLSRKAIEIGLFF